MLDWLFQGLGFVSAGLVALIAVAFGLMFLFFSGSAALILGHFLRFVRELRVAGISLGLAVGLAWIAGLWLAPDAPVWGLAALQAGCGGVAWALVRWTRIHRALQRGLGAGLLACGLLFALSLFAPSPSLGGVSLQRLGQGAVQIAFALGGLAGIGLWPLVAGGLVVHRARRPVEWWISVRYLLARRRQTVISIISGICVVGVSLGVAVITVVLSVMNGFSHMWEEKIVGSRAHFTLHSRLGEFPDYRALRERVAALEGVEAATPALATEAVLRMGGGQIQSVVLKGVDPATVAGATDLVAQLRQGSLADLTPADGSSGVAALPGVILGEQLAQRFFVRVGDPLVLISPTGGRPTPLGPAPRMERFRLAGLFRSDFFQFDESYVYTSLEGAQQFMRLGDVVSAIEVRTHDAYRSRQVARGAEIELGGTYYARDWKDFYPGFFQALKTERAMMFVLLSFIMVVAGFIIIATLIMMIMEKSRDIAILKTMGCEDEGILRIFAIQGLLIGLVGLALGLGMGLVITVNLETIQAVVERTLGIDVLPANVYQLAGLPYSIEIPQLALVSLIAMTLSVGATLLPSWQAARLDPAEGLRYE